MTAHMTGLSGLLALLLVAASPAIAQEDARPVPGPLPPSVGVHFAPKPAGDPDGVDVHIVAFFDKAKKTLHGAFYEIREQKFVDALIAAKKRKVDVKLLVDNTSFYLKAADGTLDKKHRNPFVRQLLDADIEIRQDQDRSALMHNKFCVVDGRFVWSGSVNLTDTYATNCNNAIEMESPKLSEIYEREFDKKFTKQLFGKNAPSYAEQQKTTVEGIPLEILFAPEDDPMSRILVLLNGAKKSIHFMQFAFTEEKVTTILLTKFKAGVAVGGIFDHRLYRSTGPYGDFATLLRGGVPVQLYAGAGLFHHKVFIIDAGTPHAVVITGSQNASANGNNNNDENVLIVHDQRIADLYETEYNNRLKESSQVTAEAVYDNDPSAGSSLPALRVMIAANGVGIKRIKVEYPARWPVEDAAGLGIWRNGKAITKTCGLQFYAKGLYINSPGMSPSGCDSQIELHFKRLKVPEIPGVYNLYVSIADGDNLEDLKPCRVQPTINVIGDGPGNARVAAVPHPVQVSGYVQSPDSRDEAVTVAGPAETADALRADVSEDIEAGKLTNARRYVEYLEARARSGNGGAGAVPAKGREIRRALRTVPEKSPLFAQAQDLLRRLETAAP